MDRELEMLCEKNAERRRFAEEYDLEQRLEQQAARAAEKKELELKKWRRWGRNAKMLGQVHLAVSAVLALLDLPLWAVMGLFGAAFYYLCGWEFRLLEAHHGG